jgi:uncharacterized membrane protein YccC
MGTKVRSVKSLGHNSNSIAHRQVAALWRTVLRFDPSKLQFEIAARNALASAIPLIAGALAGAPGAGVVASIGALNASFFDRDDSYFQRARRLLAVSVLGAFAVFAAGVSGGTRPLAALLVVCCGFIAGLSVALGSTVSFVGVALLVALIVFSAQPLSLERSAALASLALAGGLIETIVAVAFWPVYRRRPEQIALADAYRELSSMASAPVDLSGPPVATSQMSRAQDALSTLYSEHTIQAERYLSLLNQAERIRLRLLILNRLRNGLDRQPAGHPYAQLLDACFDRIAALLRGVAGALEASEDGRLVVEHIRGLDELAERFREPVEQMQMAATVQNARIQLDSVLGQLRSAMDLAGRVTSRGEREFVHRQARRPWRLRLGGVLATLRANLTLRSSFFRHAVRLAACLAAGELVAAVLGWHRSYWLPMTIALVLRPDFGSTFTRGVLRLAGTLAGLVATTALVHFASPGIGLEIACIIVCIFLLRYLGPANYALLTANASAAVVLVIAVTGIAPNQVIVARAINTAAGGMLALVAYILWPTWEREQAGEAFADLLDAYRLYFHTVRSANRNPGASETMELDRTRQAARVARTNVEASVDRMLEEPGTRPERAKLLVAMLASSHRLVHAMMSLEAGLVNAEPSGAPPAFQSFTHAVELTLHSLAAGLRGSPLEPAHLPDLREAHRALLGGSDASKATHELVSSETDLLTNSLNTLAEQAFEWIAPQQGTKLEGRV